MDDGQCLLDAISESSILNEFLTPQQSDGSGQVSYSSSLPHKPTNTVAWLPQTESSQANTNQVNIFYPQPQQIFISPQQAQQLSIPAGYQQVPSNQILRQSPVMGHVTAASPRQHSTSPQPNHQARNVPTPTGHQQLLNQQLQQQIHSSSPSPIFVNSANSPLLNPLTLAAQQAGIDGSGTPPNVDISQFAQFSGQQNIFLGNQIFGQQGGLRPGMLQQTGIQSGVQQSGLQQSALQHSGSQQFNLQQTGLQHGGQQQGSLQSNTQQPIIQQGIISAPCQFIQPKSNSTKQQMFTVSNQSTINAMQPQNHFVQNPVLQNAQVMNLAQLMPQSAVNVIPGQTHNRVNLNNIQGTLIPTSHGKGIIIPNIQLGSGQQFAFSMPQVQQLTVRQPNQTHTQTQSPVIQGGGLIANNAAGTIRFAGTNAQPQVNIVNLQGTQNQSQIVIQSPQPVVSNHPQQNIFVQAMPSNIVQIQQTPQQTPQQGGAPQGVDTGPQILTSQGSIPLQQFINANPGQRIKVVNQTNLITMNAAPPVQTPVAQPTQPSRPATKKRPPKKKNVKIEPMIPQQSSSINQKPSLIPKIENQTFQDVEYFSQHMKRSNSTVPMGNSVAYNQTVPTTTVSQSYQTTLTNVTDCSSLPVSSSDLGASNFLQDVLRQSGLGNLAVDQTKSEDCQQRIGGINPQQINVNINCMQQQKLQQQPCLQMSQSATPPPIVSTVTKPRSMTFQVTADIKQQLATIQVELKQLLTKDGLTIEDRVRLKQLGMRQKEIMSRAQHHSIAGSKPITMANPLQSTTSSSNSFSSQSQAINQTIVTSHHPMSLNNDKVIIKTEKAWHSNPQCSGGTVNSPVYPSHPTSSGTTTTHTNVTLRPSLFDTTPPTARMSPVPVLPQQLSAPALQALNAVKRTTPPPAPELNSAQESSQNTLSLITSLMTPVQRDKLHAQLAKLTPEQQQVFYQRQATIIRHLKEQRANQQIQVQVSSRSETSLSSAQPSKTDSPVTHTILPTPTTTNMPGSTLTSISTSASTTTPLARTVMHQQLKRDQCHATMADQLTAFKSYRQAMQRLLRFHVYQGHGPSPTKLQKFDSDFETFSQNVLDKTSHMINKYHYLLLQDSMRTCSTAEVIQLQRLAIADLGTLIKNDKALAAKHPDKFISMHRFNIKKEVDLKNEDNFIEESLKSEKNTDDCEYDKKVLNKEMKNEIIDDAYGRRIDDYSRLAIKKEVLDGCALLDDEYRGGEDEHRGGEDEYREGEDEYRGVKDESGVVEEERRVPFESYTVSSVLTSDPAVRRDVRHREMCGGQNSDTTVRRASKAGGDERRGRMTEIDLALQGLLNDSDLSENYQYNPDDFKPQDPAHMDVICDFELTDPFDTESFTCDTTDTASDAVAPGFSRNSYVHCSNDSKSKISSVFNKPFTYDNQYKQRKLSEYGTSNSYEPISPDSGDQGFDFQYTSSNNSQICDSNGKECNNGKNVDSKGEQQMQDAVNSIIDSPLDGDARAYGCMQSTAGVLYQANRASEGVVDDLDAAVQSILM